MIGKLRKREKKNTKTTVTGVVGQTPKTKCRRLKETLLETWWRELENETGDAAFKESTEKEHKKKKPA